MSFGSRMGLLLVILGLALGSPLLIILGAFNIATSPLTIAAIGAGIGGVVAGGIAIPLIACLLSFYCGVGLTYFFSAARTGYETNLSIFGVLGAYSGGFNTVLAVLWSPFILLGAAFGKGSHALVNFFSRKKEQPLLNDNIPLSPSVIAAGLGQTKANRSKANHHEIEKEVEEEADVLEHNTSYTKLFKENIVEEESHSIEYDISCALTS